jgi:hypothetical protein
MVPASSSVSRFLSHQVEEAHIGGQVLCGCGHREVQAEQLGRSLADLIEFRLQLRGQPLAEPGQSLLQ